MALSRLGDPSDCDCVMATAHLDGRLRGLLHFVPWGTDGLSLDLMRRDRTADNGLNEFMIAELMNACPRARRRAGVAELRGLPRRDRTGRADRRRPGAAGLARACSSSLSRWWQIESLYRFNVKFRPYWEPRFLSYPAARDIPRIAVAALEAEAFLVRPKLLKRLTGRR